MASEDELVADGEFLLSEVGMLSREEVTIVSGQNLVAGTVVGKITASGKYAAFNNDAGTGVETVVGILLNAVDASAGDKKGVIIERLAEVKGELLNWNTTDNDADDITAGIAELLTKNIKVR